MDLAGKRVIVSGGAGFIGWALVKRLLALDCDVTVVSRDEDKHRRLRSAYPQVRTRVCDVRDLDQLARHTAGHDLGIWAGSLKQIDTCARDFEVAKQVIVDGAINARRVSEEHLEAAVFLSTDKAKAPTTLYGYLKGAAGEAFLAAPRACRLTTAVYGNVWNSTGSVVPAIWEAIARGRTLTLFSPQMTRFMLDAERAVEVVLAALAHDGCYVLPELEAFRVGDLFELYAERFGLAFEAGAPRPSEKIHETMATAEEVPRMRRIGGGHYLIDLDRTHGEVEFPSGSYCSRDHVVDKARLERLLEERAFFRPRA